eukprot:COSAG01_NODE_24467_length_777_cov_141.827434_1_plen_60_part_00
MDGVAGIVSNVATKYLRDAQLHLDAGRQLTRFAQEQLDCACNESADMHAVGTLVAGHEP